MRTLLLSAVLAGSIAVPAASLAAPDVAVCTSPLEQRVAVREANSQLALATARAKRKATPPAQKVDVPPHLQAIAQCESGGDPTAIGGGGLYRGKYQFSYDTWAGVGGHGDPAAAPESEQDMRAALLYERSGPGQWPVCGS